MVYRKEQVELACKHLCKNDRVMRGIIKRVGPFTLKTKRDYFQTLVESIVSQQISTAAARTIMQRLRDHLHPETITPEAMAKLNAAVLRTIGISSQKASYTQDLTERVVRGELNLRTINRRADDAVIAELIQVKGIGVWTAHMFMIFALGRMDVLPIGDYGVRTAIQRQYGLAELPSPVDVQTIAQPWRPFASVASWYLWRSLEFAPLPR